MSLASCSGGVSTLAPGPPCADAMLTSISSPCSLHIPTIFSASDVTLVAGVPFCV